MFSIEEPENYLHPLMLSEIISIMRTYTKKERLILMSTHSETLLNNATPDEIIVVSYKNGKTTAKRVSNANELTTEIRDTGFGLGYYYMSGSFDNE
jgi:predicted ATPase